MHAILNFLKNHVNGKTLYTDEMTYRLKDNTVDGVYSDQVSFSNLRWNDNGFSLDLFVVSNEKLYRREGERRSELIKDFSAVSLFRYELAKRRSSGALTGCFRLISSSLAAPVPAEAVVSAIYRLCLNGETLSWVEDQALYRDQPNAEGGFDPVAFKAPCRLYLDAGKLVFEYPAECYAVNATTLKRESAGANYPPFISRER